VQLFHSAKQHQFKLHYNMVLTSTSVKRYNVDMAAAIIAGIPTLIVYVLAGKYFIRGLTAGSVKG
jgi:glucose/mannose transport system permease protein